MASEDTAPVCPVEHGGCGHANGHRTYATHLGAWPDLDYASDSCEVDECMCHGVTYLRAQLAAAQAELATLNRERIIDGKFAVRCGQIVKMSSGEVVPEDEPLVLMRARDRLALPTLNHYRLLCEMDGCNDFQMGKIEELLAKFAAYAADPNRMKQPGVTRGAAWLPEVMP